MTQITGQQVLKTQLMKCTYTSEITFTTPPLWLLVLIVIATAFADIAVTSILNSEFSIVAWLLGILVGTIVYMFMTRTVHPDQACTSDNEQFQSN